MGGCGVAKSGKRIAKEGLHRRSFSSHLRRGQLEFSSAGHLSKVIEKNGKNCMAAAKGAKLSCLGVSLLALTGGHLDGRNSFHGSARSQPAGGDRAAMVLSRPVSCHARTAAMLGVQGYLTE
jgi:hypothetical protein